MDKFAIRSLHLVAACVLVLVAGNGVSFDGVTERHALVIGNQSYPTAPLRNPINDANAISEKLTKLGFSVTQATDTNLTALEAIVAEFYAGLSEGSPGGTLALVYYAGHAVQINNRNYLVPVDVSPETPAAFLRGLYDINDLFAQIPGVADLQSVIVLDACRNNPFAGLDALVDDGLAPLRAPSGTLIAFATEPGSTAEDGEGRNGVYTAHLLKHLARKIPIEDVLKRVRRGVARETRKRQIPWEHSSLLEEVYVNPPRNREVPDLISF